jgi:hypothetical protein
LNGKAGSEITHIINRTGGRVHASSPAGAMRQTYRDFAGTRPGGGAATGTKQR